jgi:single-strand DNA-binding protein
MAVNRRWKNQAGEQQEEVMFVDCDAFGRTAELINQFFRKGRPIFIEGRLKLDQWQDKDGNKRSRHKIVVEAFDFVDSKSGSGEGAAGGSGGSGDAGSGPMPPRSAPPRPANRPAPAPAAGPGPSPDMEPHPAPGEEDIPF